MFLKIKRTNKIVAAMKHVIPSWKSGFLFFLKHFQHPVRNNKTANHVERSKDNGKKTQQQGKVIVAFCFAHDDDGANDDYSMNSVGTTHQWRMQYTWYTP